MPVEELSGNFECEECKLGKATRQPFPRITSEQNARPARRIYADFDGKISVRSYEGTEYFLILKDHATSFRASYCLKQKREAAKCIKNFIALIEKNTNTAVKTFVTDNGGEFVNTDLVEYFD